MAQITINIDKIPIEYRYSTYPCLCFLLPSISSSRRTPERVRFCQYIVAPWRIIGAHARSLIDSICPKSTLGEVESVVRVCTLTDPILISQVPSLSLSDSDSLSLSHTHTHTLSLFQTLVSLSFSLLLPSDSRWLCLPFTPGSGLFHKDQDNDMTDKKKNIRSSVNTWHPP
jgi:hypothetical protein